MTRPADIRAVQALRAAACVMVVIYHAVTCQPGREQSMPNLAAGVDLFFVISGYVMVVSSRRLVGRGGWRRFLLHRARRIVPLYWLLTLVKLCLATLLPGLTPHTRPGVWNLVASLLFIPARDRLGVVRPILPVGWTLNFEALFYVLFAVALAARVHPLWMSPFLCVLAVAGFWREPGWPAPSMLANGMVLEFAAGMVIGSKECSFLKKRTKKLLFRACIASGPRVGPNPGATNKSFLVLFFKKELLLLYPLLALLLILPSAGPWRFLLWGGPAAAILAAALTLEDKLGPRLPRWLLAIGDASYAIYLVHPLIVPGLARHGVLAATVAVPASLVAGVAVHAWLDAPLQRRLAGKRPAVPAYAAGAGVLSG
jgi:peptidoglycan/LPS O-acetylase OafA/YrhL